MLSFIKSMFQNKKQEMNMANEVEEAEKELIERLKKHEGIRLNPYRCTAGKITIGVGRNLEDNGISMEEAEFMLKNDIARCYKELRDNFPWEKNLNPRRRGVLCEMIFNMGISRFSKFKNMLKACEEEDFEKASKEALDSSWHNQVGKRAETLAKILLEG